MIPFLITIDVEGDNLWEHPATITTKNARHLPRFHALCERFDLKPTYLTNYEMASDDSFVEFARSALGRQTAEIGMHLHAWNSPPHFSLTPDDNKFHPYLIEYPQPVMRTKIEFMTRLLEDTFGIRVRSHRAGRWSFDATYASILIELGYVVDCSVTPHVSWRRTLGNPAGAGGTDYRFFPRDPYWLDENDIARPGRSPLLEVPMTITRGAPQWIGKWMSPSAAPKLAAWLRDHGPAQHWLRPNGSNLASMKNILDRAADESRPCVEFMIHSSEFMPGGSPYFPTEPAVEGLYRDIEQLFEHAAGRFRGMTLSEFHDSFKRSGQHA